MTNQSSGSSQQQGLFQRVFKLQEHGTTARTEVVAGFTTFLTMVYIVFVNPQILSVAGMDIKAVFVTTCLIAAIGSILMGLLANLPIAVAPAMGLNAFLPLWLLARWAIHGKWLWGQYSGGRLAYSF